MNVDFEQAGELKIGQVGIANLRIRTLDVPRLVREMQDRVTVSYTHLTLPTILLV